MEPPRPFGSTYDAVLWGVAYVLVELLPLNPDPRQDQKSASGPSEAPDVTTPGR
jgi:hypothetical protein